MNATIYIPYSTIVMAIAIFPIFLFILIMNMFLCSNVTTHVLDNTFLCTYIYQSRFASDL